jgi:cyclophilin family peptidyl-prolyl cis-trans isomerase
MQGVRNRLSPWNRKTGWGMGNTIADAHVQFFIAYGKQPSLDGKYTIFGK